jgi:hypothetical protein
MAHGIAFRVRLGRPSELIAPRFVCELAFLCPFRRLVLMLFNRALKAAQVGNKFSIKLVFAYEAATQCSH